MRGLFEHGPRKCDRGVLAPLAMQHTNKFVKELVFRPDAKCEDCGCLVWRCTSIHGDVFFLDLLGPPWPKHDCPAEGEIVPDRDKQRNCQVSSKAYSRRDAFRWLKDGWCLIYEVSLQPSEEEAVMKLHFTFEKSRMILKVDRKEVLRNWVGFDIAADRLHGAISFMRPSSEPGFFEISLMDSRMSFCLFSAYK